MPIEYYCWRDNGKVISNGMEYCLSHFRPITSVLPQQGKDDKDITVIIIFHSHVFTTAYDTESRHVQLQDHRDNHPRTFSPNRYELSVDLPNICRRMIDDNFLTWESEDRAQVNHMAVAGRNPIRGQPEYHIYYSLRPDKRSPDSVILEIKSAYTREFFGSKRKKNMRNIIKKCYYEGKNIP